MLPCCPFLYTLPSLEIKQIVVQGLKGLYTLHTQRKAGLKGSTFFGKYFLDDQINDFLGKLSTQWFFTTNWKKNLINSAPAARVSIKNYKQCWLVKGCSSLLEFQNKFQSNCIDRVVWTFYYVRITLVGWEFRAGDSDNIVYWIHALYSNFPSSVPVIQISTQLIVMS